MSKLLLSARITKNFFNEHEIKEIEKELEGSSKSEFIRKVIKYYLHNNNIEFNYDEASNKLEDKQLEELKNLIKINQNLLEDLKKRGYQVDVKEQDVYEGEEQEMKRDKILGLLNNF